MREGDMNNQNNFYYSSIYTKENFKENKYYIGMILYILTNKNEKWT